jgi:phage anti-repressor protein
MASIEQIQALLIENNKLHNDLLRKIADLSNPDLIVSPSRTLENKVLQFDQLIDHNKHLSISSFNNKTRVDLREYYIDSNGLSKPTQKGVSLSIDAFFALNTSLPLILSSHNGPLDDGFLIDHNKRISLSSFRNKTRVDIREYYIDSNGLSKPTKKGVSISIDDFYNLQKYSHILSGILSQFCTSQ